MEAEQIKPLTPDVVLARDLVDSALSNIMHEEGEPSPKSGIESVLSKDEIHPDDQVAPIDSQPWVDHENTEMEAAWLRSIEAQPLCCWYDPMVRPVVTAPPKSLGNNSVASPEVLVPLGDKEIWKANAWKAGLHAAQVMRDAHFYAQEARDTAISEVWRRKREDLQERRQLADHLQAEREQMTAKMEAMVQEVENARRLADMRVAEAHVLAEKLAKEADERVEQAREECSKAIAAANARAADAEKTAAAHVAAADKRVADCQACIEAAKVREDENAKNRKALEAVNPARTQSHTKD